MRCCLATGGELSGLPSFFPLIPEVVISFTGRVESLPFFFAQLTWYRYAPFFLPISPSKLRGISGSTVDRPQFTFKLKIFGGPRAQPFSIKSPLNLLPMVSWERSFLSSPPAEKILTPSSSPSFPFRSPLLFSAFGESTRNHC